MLIKQYLYFFATDTRRHRYYFTAEVAESAENTYYYFALPQRLAGRLWCAQMNADTDIFISWISCPSCLRNFSPRHKDRRASAEYAENKLATDTRRHTQTGTENTYYYFAADIRRQQTQIQILFYRATKIGGQAQPPAHRGLRPGGRALRIFIF